MCEWISKPIGIGGPGHPSVGGHNEYRPKGVDAVRLGSKGRYGLCVGGKMNCDYKSF